MSFQDLLGKPLPFDIIKNGLQNNHLSASLLFFGPASCGKMKTAYSVAKALNCLEQTNDFCDQCPGCLKINHFSHPDVVIINTDDVITKINLLYQYFSQHAHPQIFAEIIFYLHDLYYRYSSGFFALKGPLKNSKKAQADLQDKITEHKILLGNISKQANAELDEKTQKKLNKVLETAKHIYDNVILNNIPIEAIRKVLHKLYMTPIEGKNKVFIINGLEWMREESANTFLKGIEEPPPHNNIILITENIDSILPTIKSRCFQIPFYALSNEEQKVILQRQFGISISENDKKTETLWSFLLKKDDDGLNQLVNHFFNSVVVNYQQGTDIFAFADRVIEKQNIRAFLFLLYERFRQAKQIKNAIIEVDEENALYALPDSSIDRLVKEGEQILFKMETFNLNPSMTLSSYLIKIARQYNLAEKSINA